MGKPVKKKTENEYSITIFEKESGGGPEQNTKRKEKGETRRVGMNARRIHARDFNKK